MIEVILLSRVVAFAADKHTDHRRKGGRQIPYMNHLVEVAALVAEATGGRDLNLVAAAYLHDTVEDTDTTYEELVQHFGTDVADLVREVSDDKSLEKAERKRLQIETAAKKTKRAQTLKLADKISNLRSLYVDPPEGWSKERKLNYVAWATQVAEQMSGANPRLEKEFRSTAETAIAAIEEDD